MDLFKRKKSISNSKTVSDENTEMLPSNKQSKSDIITKKTNALLVIIAIGMLGVFIDTFEILKNVQDIAMLLNINIEGLSNVVDFM